MTHGHSGWQGVIETADSILILGVGNPLMRDDGFGPRVAEMLLKGYDFPDNVEVIDVGTMSFAILNLLVDRDHLVVVDAVHGTENLIGSVMRLSPDQVASSEVSHTVHDRPVADVLQAVKLLGGSPSTVVVAVQIGTIVDAMPQLSPEVEAAVPIAAAAVLDELEHLGAPAIPRNSDVHAKVLRAMSAYSPSSRSIRSAIDSASNPAIANRSDDAPED
jgi:hydrogenase maturation protease